MYCGHRVDAVVLEYSPGIFETNGRTEDYDIWPKMLLQYGPALYFPIACIACVQMYVCVCVCVCVCVSERKGGKRHRES